MFVMVKMASIFPCCLLLMLASVFGEDLRKISKEMMGYTLSGHRSYFRSAAICPKDEGVSGFRVRSQSKAGKEKSEGYLTGLEMKCQDGTVLGGTDLGRGDWSKWENCEESDTPENYVTGYAYRADPSRGGAQFKFRCSNNKEIVPSPENFDFGIWFPEPVAGAEGYHQCKEGEKLCGFVGELYRKLGRIKFLCCSTSDLKPLQSPDGSKVEWSPLGINVCIGAKDDNYGIIKMPTKGRFLMGLKFEYVSGMLTCDASSPQFDSHFGCNHHKTKRAFSIYVTTDRNEVVLPDGGYQKSPADKSKYYYVISHDAREAKEFAIMARNPTYIPVDGELRVWYGEDLRGRHHDRNNGDTEVCVNVFGKFLE